jgi:hypothetical protein
MGMKSVWWAVIAAAVMCVSATSSIRGYQFAPDYRADAPRLSEPVIGSYQHIRTVAVLSGIGGRLELERRGDAGKNIATLDISAWQVDERVEATVRNVLHPRFRFVRAALDQNLLAGLREGPKSIDVYLKALPAQDVDAFVIVRPNGNAGLALQTVQHRDTILWVDFEIDVVDAHTHAVIARSTARVQAPDTPHANFPGLVVGSDFALDRTMTLNADQKEKLRGLTNEMLTLTLTETLKALKLAAR